MPVHSAVVIVIWHQALTKIKKAAPQTPKMNPRAGAKGGNDEKDTVMTIGRICNREVVSVACSERKSNMQSALQITSDDMPHSAAFDARIREKVVKLEQICPRLAACRVVVIAPHRQQQHRRQFTVRLSITFPGGEVVVTRDNHEDINVLLRDAFVAVRRELDRCAGGNGGVALHLEGCGCHGIAARLEPFNA